jgi:hypothetical protein
MNKVLPALLLGWLMAYSTPGLTEGSGSDLLRQCSQAVRAIDGVTDPNTVDFGDAGRCMGQIEGFAGAAAFYESKPGSPRAICFPAEGMTIGQSVRVVNKFLQNHPEQLHEPSTVLIFGAFLTAYPCP